MKPLIEANINVLIQIRELVNLCDDSVYNAVIAHSQSSIGKHIRHILDHYRAVMQGQALKNIDYNYRDRGSDVETMPAKSLTQIEILIEWLLRYSIEDNALTVTSEVKLDSVHSSVLPSNNKRELLYLINHSIHHIAYAALLGKLQGLTIPEHIGLAPCTASFERSLREHKNEKTMA
ncbi:hypothetical protein [Reinekea sp.]|jgi:uncharacterized damage-inducible protein DinB|uniref:hypothetical protein n=1 Tax=Reinekea sp. TaxID=1970455 RepID=UPI00398A2282